MSEKLFYTRYSEDLDSYLVGVNDVPIEIVGLVHNPDDDICTNQLYQEQATDPRRMYKYIVEVAENERDRLSSVLHALGTLGYEPYTELGPSQ